MCIYIKSEQITAFSFTDRTTLPAPRRRYVISLMNSRWQDNESRSAIDKSSINVMTIDGRQHRRVSHVVRQIELLGHVVMTAEVGNV
jgi:hypothetical protein